MQATWSQPVAELEVFSNDFASRRVSMTTIDGVASARPSTSRTAACNAVKAAPQVPLRDQRRNCDHTRVLGPERLGEKPPLATGLRNVEHRVHHTPQVRPVLGSALARRV